MGFEFDVVDFICGVVFDFYWFVVVNNWVIGYDIYDWWGDFVLSVEVFFVVVGGMEFEELGIEGIDVEGMIIKFWFDRRFIVVGLFGWFGLSSIDGRMMVDLFNEEVVVFVGFNVFKCFIE